MGMSMSFRVACLILAAAFAGGAQTRMTVEQRERLLLTLATSPVPQLRSGFQALKRLTNFLSYSATDGLGENMTWRSIGYRPSPLPAPDHTMTKFPAASIAAAGAS